MNAPMNGKDFEISGEDLGRVLRQSSMLAQLTTRKWSASVNDERAVGEIRRAKNAKGAVGRFNKNLLAGVDGPLRAIKTLMQLAYNEHRRLTLPWVVDGQRLLAVTRMPSYLNTMNGYVAQLQPMVDDFVGKYDQLVQGAEDNLGDLFNPSEYPSASRIGKAFAIDVSLQPVPASTDWRQLTGMNDTAIKALGVHTVRKVEEACRGARDELRMRTRNWCDRAIKSLVPKEDDPTKPAVVFHSTLVTELQQTAEDLRTLNITGDRSIREMEGILFELGARVGDDVKELKEQPDLRAWVVDRAREAVRILDEYVEGERG